MMNFHFKKRFILTALAIIVLTLHSPNPALAGDKAPPKTIPDQFGIYSVNLDGSEMKLILGNSYQQMTHIHVSPNGQWITFSRYNDKGKDGLAKEMGDAGGNHYENTEIMLSRFDGTYLRSLIPPKKGVFAVNSYWTSDGKSMLYLSTENQKKLPEIRRVDLTFGNMQLEKISTVNVPPHLIPIDPHQVGEWIVFPAVDLKTKIRALWIMNANGSGLRQLTTPTSPKTGKVVYHPDDGENDPKFSPDGSKVAFMRRVKGAYEWHIFVVDVNTGVEKDLSAAYIPEGYKAMDFVPEWSSDGKLIVFTYADLKKLEFHLYTMKPDGSERTRIPIPPAIFPQSPSFYPNAGSGSKAKIIFGAQKIDPFKLKLARLLKGSNK